MVDQPSSVSQVTQPTVQILWSLGDSELRGGVRAVEQKKVVVKLDAVSGTCSQWGVSRCFEQAVSKKSWKGVARIQCQA